MEGSHLNIQRNTLATFDTAGMRINPNQCEVNDNIRALIVGDFNIAGLFLDDSETIGAKIVDQSSLKGSCIDIDIFGVSGYGPDQSFFAVEKITTIFPMTMLFFISLLTMISEI